jgi:hypothetical protein
MPTPTLRPQVPRLAAKRRLAASSVTPVASGYERSLRPCDARFSLPVNVISSGGGR